MVWRIARPVAVLATAGLVVVALAAPGTTAPRSENHNAAARRTAPSMTPREKWRRAGLTGPGHVKHVSRRGEVDVNLCSDAVAPGFARCAAHIREDLIDKGAQPHAGAARPDTVGADGAYDPSYLQSAYNAPAATNGSGQTVAIVDAFDAPNAESDLAQYRSHYGLSACTTANGCFRKVDQNGGTNYPAYNSGWEYEISLDIDMVSAICPRCNILLVEATNSSFTNLGIAVNRAVTLGADVVSNSYGGPEWSGQLQADSDSFNHPGVALVASTGDDGYGVSYPAASPTVVAVGGTNLVQTTNTGTRNATETAWAGGGSGCSAFEPKPAWQTDSGCSRRTLADVAAVADPSTGVWAYNGGWYVLGGTSVSSPIVGALYALAGNAASSANLASYPYAHPTEFNDVVSGSNGSCGGTYLCTARAGYDGPTGLGTPNRVVAFTPGSGPALPAPDFSLSATAVPITKPGGHVKSTITVTSHNGFSGSVHLVATYTPSLGLTKSLTPVTVSVGTQPGKSTLAIQADKAGVYTLTVKATSGSLAHSRVLTVKVNDFSISVSPTKRTIARGGTTHYTVTLTPKGAFKSAVTLAVTGVSTRDKVTYSHNPAPASGSQTITVKTSTLDAKGTITVHIKATSGSIVHTVAATLVLT